MAARTARSDTLSDAKLADPTTQQSDASPEMQPTAAAPRSRHPHPATP